MNNHPPGQTPALATLRAEAAEFLRAQSLDGWQNWAWGKDSHLEQLYATHPGLFTQESLAAVRQARQQAAGGDDAIAMFEGYLEREWIGRQTAALQDRLANREAAAEVTLAGETFSFRQLPVKLANEPDGARRARLHAAADPVYRELNPLRLQMLEAAHRLSRELGYDGYIALATRQKSLDLEQLRGICRAWLEQTEELYRQLLDEQLQQELGTGRDAFTRADTARLLRCQRFDPLFPRERLLPALEETLRGLDIDLNQQKNILLDTEDRARKVPRAVMFPINAPQDIRISIRPVGGIDDFAALFHEMGHAQHFAHTTETDWEFRNVGASNAVTEVFAFLFEHLLDDAGWLRQYLGFGEAEARAFLRSRAFRRLFMLRRYCGKLEYESRLHAGAAHPEAEYAGLLAAALLYHREASEELRYLADVDDLFYSADYLRAWFLEAQLTEHLRRSFGPQWYTTAAAGSYLQQLWSTGQKEEPAGFARRAGLGDLNPAVLQTEIVRLTGKDA